MAEAVFAARKGELLKPLHTLIEAHVRAAARLHGDDTTVPLLARGGTKTARLWTYVRDDRPFASAAPPAVVFRFSRDRAGAQDPMVIPRRTKGVCATYFAICSICGLSPV